MAAHLEKTKRIARSVSSLKYKTSMTPERHLRVLKYAALVTEEKVATLTPQEKALFRLYYITIKRLEEELYLKTGNPDSTIQYVITIQKELRRRSMKYGEKNLCDLAYKTWNASYETLRYYEQNKLRLCLDVRGD